MWVRGGFGQESVKIVTPRFYCALGLGLKAMREREPDGEENTRNIFSRYEKDRSMLHLAG